jgi:hypothetical protein
MLPPAFLLAELSPSRAAELGVAAGQPPWTSGFDPQPELVVVHHAGLDEPEAGAIARSGLRDEPLDLVIDHAGSDDDRLRARFSRWFAALGPGGAYVVDGRPHDRFVLEAMLATVAHDVIDRVRLEGSVLVVVRTLDPLDGDRFDLAGAYTDPFDLLLRAR